jgi:hypothetical protein
MNSESVTLSSPLMKMQKISRIIVSVALLVAAAPLLATTLSVPNDQPAFSVDIPADWKPKLDKADKSVEASEPDDHVYMYAWVVPAQGQASDLASDLDALLKDSMKSVDEKKTKEIIKHNGIEFLVFRGSGIDKREGSKVEFFVALFEAGKDKIGVYYVDYDTDAPPKTVDTIFSIMNSIKLKS